MRSAPTDGGAAFLFRLEAEVAIPGFGVGGHEVGEFGGSTVVADEGAKNQPGVIDPGFTVSVLGARLERNPVLEGFSVHENFSAIS